MRTRLLATVALLAVSFLWRDDQVHAHPLSPAALLIDEVAPNQYRVEFRRPEGAARALVVDLPASCQERDSSQGVNGDLMQDRVTLDCSRSLEGQTVRVLGLTELSLSALVHVSFLDGRSVRGLLGPDQSGFVIPRRSSPLRVLGQYVWLGVEHLLTGWDHLLFVIGLIVMMPQARRLLLTLTAFTAGHSITLCLATLSVLSVPQEPVEIAIALSLMALALALLGDGARAARSAWMAGGFGLLHGLGFAGALAETGLPRGAIPLSLFGFNLGVELGQLLVVAAAVPLSAAARRWFPVSRPRVQSLVAYAIGSLAAMWCIERTVAWLG